MAGKVELGKSILRAQGNRVVVCHKVMGIHEPMQVRMHSTRIQTNPLLTYHAH